jgi:hypothetical protein
MNRKLLEQQREGVKAQLRWAVLHGGDQELLDLLRIESDRLLAMIGQCPRSAALRGCVEERVRRRAPFQGPNDRIVWPN